MSLRPIFILLLCISFSCLFRAGLELASMGNANIKRSKNLWGQFLGNGDLTYPVQLCFLTTEMTAKCENWDEPAMIQHLLSLVPDRSDGSFTDAQIPPSTLWKESLRDPAQKSWQEIKASMKGAFESGPGYTAKDKVDLLCSGMVTIKF